MSGIARIMLARGIAVSGSDARDSALLGELQALGASVYVGHAAANLGRLGPGDTLVVSSAIRADNQELAEAARRGMRVLHRAAALASVMAGRRGTAGGGRPGPGGGRGAPGPRARPPLRRIAARRLPPPRRGVAGNGDQLHGRG